MDGRSETAAVYGINFWNAAESVVPIHVVHGRLGGFYEMHVGIVVVAVVFVCSVIVYI